MPRDKVRSGLFAGGRWIRISGSARDKGTVWVRQTYAATEPFIAPGRYVNYLDDDETGDSVPAAYGPNYRRLREIKTKYDPGNFFHLNQNIRRLM